VVARLQVGEALHLRLVCAQATTGSAVSFASEATGAVLPFYVFASDGISYAQPVRKTLLVVGVGQREGVLVRFAVPGRVLIMQGIINDFQGTGGGQGPGPNSTDRVAAYIDVVAASQPGLPTGPPLEQLQFTPGMGNATIAPADIGAQLGVRFEVNSDLSRVPSPQFVIGGRPFDYKAITATLPARGAAQWTLTSNMNYFHPFHIHVNPFVVKSVVTGYAPGSSLFERAIVETNTVPPNKWRDTIFIPPLGSTTIWQHFGHGRVNAWQGKTVYHCHFLDHEDQGMMAAFLLTGPDQPFRESD